MYLAKKYLISSLAEKCCSVLEASVRPGNVFTVLEQAMQFDEKKLEEKANIVGCSRFDVSNLGSGWSYSGCNSDTLTVAVNKAVLFHGVRLFSDPHGSQYEVKFTITNKNTTGTYTSIQDNDGVWGYDVMLAEPIFLERDENFTIIATIKGQPSYWGQNGKSSVKVNDIVVTFTDTERDLSPNGTKTIHGQFHKIFLSNL